MKKSRKKLAMVGWMAVCVAVIVFLILSFPDIENRTWVLSYAQQTEAPYLVVANGKDFDVSAMQDPIFSSSEQVELICEAKDGTLRLTDKTNGKTYEGSYQRASDGGARSFREARYTVVIEGTNGTASINPGAHPTLFVSVDGYCLHFDLIK